MSCQIVHKMEQYNLKGEAHVVKSFTYDGK